MYGARLRQNVEATYARAIVKVRGYRGRIPLFFESICNKHKKYVVSVISLVVAGMSAPIHAQQTDEIVEFDIPAQKLSNALKSYGVTADRQVLFAVNLVRGKQANAVSGEMRPDMALDKLLVGSGLAYDTTVSDVVVIKAVHQDASAGQTLRVATVDEDDVGSVTVSQDGEDVLQELEEIIVTGTNIRGVTNPTVPVQQFDREDIDLSGAATVEDFLRTIPQNFSGLNPIASGSGNDFNNVNNSLNGTGVDLRGLGAGATLTLLNGRRMTASGLGNFVDVSVLPLGAIERVDVLTDGASAIYGSDAVAGVVNFITRKDFEGLEVRARYGMVTDGSKEDYGLGAAGGVNWGGGGALFGVDYNNVEPLFARERDFINLLAGPDALIGTIEERISGTISLNQSITERLSFAVDGLYSNRDSRTTNDQFTFRETRNEQDSLFINTKLDYALTDEASVSFFYDYSREDGSSADELDDFEENTFKNRLHVIEGLFSSRFLTLPSGGSLSLALGGLYREETFDGSILLSGAKIKRDVATAYGELLIPVIGEKNAIPFISAFDVSLAGRYEDYSDFGNASNPKIGLHWAVNDALSLRATFSESFRAHLR